MLISLSVLGEAVFRTYLPDTPSDHLIENLGYSLGFIVVTFTLLIAAGDTTQVIAGSVEMAYLLVQGMMSPYPAVFGFFLPVLAGHILGGTAIFALLAFGQVSSEFKNTPD